MWKHPQLNVQVNKPLSPRRPFAEQEMYFGEHRVDWSQEHHWHHAAALWYITLHICPAMPLWPERTQIWMRVTEPPFSPCNGKRRPRGQDCKPPSQPAGANRQRQRGKQPQSAQGSPSFPLKAMSHRSHKMSRGQPYKYSSTAFPPFFFLLKKTIRIRGLGVKWKPDSLTWGTSFIYSTIRFLSAEHY